MRAGISSRQNSLQLLFLEPSKVYRRPVYCCYNCIQHILTTSSFLINGHTLSAVNRPLIRKLLEAGFNLRSALPSSPVQTQSHHDRTVAHEATSVCEPSLKLYIMLMVLRREAAGKFL